MPPYIDFMLAIISATVFTKKIFLHILLYAFCIIQMWGKALTLLNNATLKVALHDL